MLYNYKQRQGSNNPHFFLGIILSSYFYGNKNVMFIALLFAVIDSHIIRNMIQSK